MLERHMENGIEKKASGLREDPPIFPKREGLGYQSGGKPESGQKGSVPSVSRGAGGRLQSGKALPPLQAKEENTKKKRYTFRRRSRGRVTFSPLKKSLLDIEGERVSGPRGEKIHHWKWFRRQGISPSSSLRPKQNR